MYHAWRKGETLQPQGMYEQCREVCCQQCGQQHFIDIERKEAAKKYRDEAEKKMKDEAEKKTKDMKDKAKKKMKDEAEKKMR